MCSVSNLFIHICSRSINRNDLVEYITTHYKGPRIVLAAAGGEYNFRVVCQRSIINSWKLLKLSLLFMFACNNMLVFHSAKSPV